jgi:integrase
MIETQNSNRSSTYTINHQACALDKKAKSLIETTRQETAPREGTKLDNETIQGLMTQYYAWLEKEGYCKESKYPKLILQLVKLGANLHDPENVKTVIARQNWRNGTKILAVWAYDIMTQILKITWTRPKYTQEEILPFIPEESELDCLIATCRSKKVATYLQTLKETFADPGEALRLRWIDISENVITINMPVKRHNPRQIRVSNKLIAMLNALPKTSERVFPTNYPSLISTFLHVRRKAANTQQNPRLLSISLTTFRHWGATMTYHYTKNILLVQKLLGHKNIKNTMKYTQLVHFKDDEYDVATATTVEEAKQLAGAGFEKFDEFHTIHIFRKPKRYNAIG